MKLIHGRGRIKTQVQLLVLLTASPCCLLRDTKIRLICEVCCTSARLKLLDQDYRRALPKILAAVLGTQQSQGAGRTQIKINHTPGMRGPIMELRSCLRRKTHWRVWKLERGWLWVESILRATRTKEQNRSDRWHAAEAWLLTRNVAWPAQMPCC